MNRVTLMGNLGKDVQLNKTGTGQSVAHFTLATNESWTANGQRMQHTEWHDVTVWGKMADNCSTYLHKGSTVLLEGRINTRTWKDEHQIDQFRKEIIASQIKFLDKKAKSAQPSKGQEQEAELPADMPSDENVPF